MTLITELEKHDNSERLDVLSTFSLYL